MSKTYGKEDELKQLKSDFVTLDRKNHRCAPKSEDADSIENKQKDMQKPSIAETPGKSKDNKGVNGRGASTRIYPMSGKIWRFC